MRHAGIALAMMAALAAAGCASEEDRHDAAMRSVKAVFAEAGFPKVTFQSVAGDGIDSLVLTGVAASSGTGVTVTLKELSFEDPDLEPMLPRWHDIGRIEVNGWVLYDGHAPKPTGFKARRVTAEGVAIAADGGARVNADGFEITDWDSTRPEGLRYSGYKVAGGTFEAGGVRLASLDWAEVEASSWQDGLPAPLKTRSKAEGSFSVPGAASFLLALSGPDIPFSVEARSEIDLRSESATMSGSFSAGDFGSLSASLEAGGVDRALLEAISEASRLEKLADGASGKSVREAAGAKVIEASQKVSLVGLRLEGKGLEWLGPVIDATFGSREMLTNMLVPAVDRGFGPGERSEAENDSLAALMLFLREPSSFTLVLDPEEPFLFAGKGPYWYLDRRSGPLRELGFGFRNDSGE